MKTSVRNVLRRTVSTLALISALALAPSAAQADSSVRTSTASDTPVTDSIPARPGWTVVSREPATDTVYHPDVGREVAVSGVKTVSVPTDQLQGDGDMNVMSVGCQMSSFMSGLSTYRQSSAPYRNVVAGHAWEELTGSTCTGSDFFYVRLREMQALYQPIVDDASGHAYANAGRKYLYVGYTCGSSTHQYRLESGFDPYLVTRTLCP